MKKLLILICGIMCFFSTNVFASTLTKEDTNYYFTRYFSDKKYSEKLYLYKMDGNVVYCVEPEVSPGTDEYHPVAVTYMNLPNDKINKILLYAYYGYDYVGHQNIKYYAAAQGLMWEEILGLVSPTTISTEPFNKGTILDVTNERYEILDLVSKHDILPSFTNTNFRSLVGATNEIVDSNNVLDKFVFDNSLSINGNKVSYVANDINTVTHTFKRKNEYTHDYELYFSENHQNMLRAGKLDVSSYKFYTSGMKKYVMIRKVDESSIPIEGVKFNIYDSNNNLLTTITTNKNGLAKTGEILGVGKYFYEEASVPDGYEIKRGKYPFEITSNYFNYTMSVVNNKINNEFKFIKYTRTKSGEKFVEPNAKFIILDKDNNIVDELTTDKDGVISLYLLYGTYTLHQVSGMDGFTLVDDLIISVNDLSDLRVIELYDEEIVKEEPKETKEEQIEEEIKEIEVEDDEEILILEDVPYTYKDDNSLYYLLFSLIILSMWEVKDEKNNN